jgi:hypothetical protein
MTGTPASCAIATIFSKSGTLYFGLPMLSSYTFISQYSYLTNSKTHINRLCLIINRTLEIFRLIPIHKLCVYAHARQHDFELVVRASIQIRRGYDVVACMRERSDGYELGCLTRCSG